ncbi:MAG TPA: glycosyltransferase family 2 protein [Methylomirabilota bacterium]|nr:glycosyltransferase family 2 protein [Methylomirabilota bacterium]
MSATKPNGAAVGLTVICVTYQSRGDVVDCLRSAVDSADGAGVATELIVVDNASTDGAADVAAAAFPAATVMRNAENRGFGAANNQAFAMARGEWWLLLNPDARLDDGTVAALHAAITANARLAAVGPSISGAGIGGAESAGMLPGLRSLASHFLFLNRLIPDDRGGAWRGWMLRPSTRTATRSVEWISGAVALLRPAAIREIGGFDESIFLYGEDTDLCARLLERGWSVGLAPSARAHHAIGGSQAPGGTRWVDGIEDFLARRGRSRVSRSVGLLCMAIGLGVRGLPRGRVAAARQARDSLRMRKAARRALVLSASVLLARPGPSGDQRSRYE